MSTHTIIDKAAERAATHFGITLYDFDATAISTPVKLGSILDEYSRKPRPKTVSVCGHTLDTVHHKLMIDGDDIKLTERETDILCMLVEADGQPVRRHDMLETIWGYVADTDTHTLETHIYRLRQKIEPSPSDPSLVVTVDDGYKLGAL